MFALYFQNVVVRVEPEEENQIVLIANFYGEALESFSKTSSKDGKCTEQTKETKRNLSPNFPSISKTQVT